MATVAALREEGTHSGVTLMNEEAGRWGGNWRRNDGESYC